MKTIRAISLFEEQWGREPEIVIEAPGRINLIGEHTDYTGGFVFPLAIEYGVSIAAETTHGPSRLISSARGTARNFDVNAIEPGRNYQWANYAAGMAWSLRQQGHAITRNVVGFVTNDLPIGSGVSSSAALEVAFGLLWCAANKITLPPKELARIAQHCENNFVGAPVGLMDMAASALGQAGHALLMDMTSFEVNPVPIPPGLTIVLCDTGKARGVATSEYASRRTQVETARDKLGLTSLRDITLPELVAKQHLLTELEFRRAHHVLSENQRCLDFKTALIQQDISTLGRLLTESHNSLQHDFEVSCPELDLMAELARAIPGCIGCRMTGAGFGGACVAIVKEPDAQSFVLTLQEHYHSARPGLNPTFLVCHASNGARRKT